MIGETTMEHSIIHPHHLHTRLAQLVCVQCGCGAGQPWWPEFGWERLQLSSSLAAGWQ